MKPTLFFSFLVLCVCQSGFAQTDEESIRSIYDEALTQGEAYENLRELCKDIGPRLSGSEGADRAVMWAEDKMRSYGFDNVWLQSVEVPKWVRGDKEICVMTHDNDSLDILALGFSVGTNGEIKGNIVEFQTLQALQNAPEGSLDGKIAFLNQGMNAKFIDTFNAYGGCAGGRVIGPSVAAGKGAIAFVMRSVGLRADDFPHTGVMMYDEDLPKIPAFALSTNAAFKLSNELEAKGEVELSLKANCRQEDDVASHNVIAELIGSENPEKYIVVGGHLDSWDVGEGAHDDGSGVVQALEVIRLFKTLGIRPKHTIRCVFFMNEENGARGGKVYAAESDKKGEKHMAAMESDRGGFSPRGFTLDAATVQIDHVAKWIGLFEPYNVHFIKPGFGGVDINPLKSQGAALVGFVPDSQRYFDVHHTANDVFENVNQRELELGAATMASLIYLIDKYGVPMVIQD